MQTQRYLINMQYDTPTTEKTPFLLDHVRIPNNTIQYNTKTLFKHDNC